jgi:hypothetical protein
MIWPRITGNRLSRAGELDHSLQNCRRQIRDRNDSLTPPFNPSKNRRVAMGDDAASVQANADAIVTNEPRKIAGFFRCRDQAQCESAFSGSGRPANEHASFPDHDCGCVEIGCFCVSTQGN